MRFRQSIPFPAFLQVCFFPFPWKQCFLPAYRLLFVISLSVVVAFVCHKAHFNPFKIVWKIFSKVSVFAVHFHFHVLHQKYQSWLGFVRFCFSAFAPHHWLVSERRKLFPSLVIVFPPLVSVVFLLWSIYCPLQ